MIIYDIDWHPDRDCLCTSWNVSVLKICDTLFPGTVLDVLNITVLKYQCPLELWGKGQPRQLAFRSLWLPLSSFELSVTVVVVVRPGRDSAIDGQWLPCVLMPEWQNLVIPYVHVCATKKRKKQPLYLLRFLLRFSDLLFLLSIQQWWQWWYQIKLARSC